MAVSRLDLQQLAREPSGKARAVVAEKIASGFTAGEFSAAEKQIAVEIFRLLLSDAEVQVRKMLSTHLAASMEVPRDVALSLAKDNAEVAVPMLQYSYVL